MTRRGVWCCAVAVALTAASASAQDAPPASTWQWTADGRVFAGFNYQRRKFTDFDAWESQNWIMLSGERRLSRGVLHLRSMFRSNRSRSATSARRRSSRPARPFAARR